MESGTALSPRFLPRRGHQGRRGRAPESHTPRLGADGNVVPCPPHCGAFERRKVVETGVGGAAFIFCRWQALRERLRGLYLENQKPCRGVSDVPGDRCCVFMTFSRSPV